MRKPLACLKRRRSVLAFERLESRALLAGYALDDEVIPMDPAEGDRFGHSVDLDGRQMAVGAPGTDDSAGAAYLLVDGGTWLQGARLTAPDPSRMDLFGFSVAVQRDRRVVVGAPQRSGERPGAVYLFVPGSGQGAELWHAQAIFTATSEHDVRDFGASLSIDGDTLIVSAPRTDGGQGAAYVFRYNGLEWLQEAELFEEDLPGLFNIAAFGSSVAIDGDTVVVGAPLSSDGASPRGIAAIYHFDGTTWQRQAYVQPLAFYTGSSVAIDGGVAVVTGDVAATVYRQSGSEWEAEQRLHEPFNASNRFSAQIAAIDGNLPMEFAKTTSHRWQMSAFDCSTTGVKRLPTQAAAKTALIISLDSSRAATLWSSSCIRDRHDSTSRRPVKAAIQPEIATFDLRP